MNALPPPKPSWLGRMGVALATVATVVVGFVTASLLFAVLLTVGLVFVGFLWWQFRRLVREAQATNQHDLEGEYTVESVRPALEDQNASSRESLADAQPSRPKPRKKRRASRSGH